MVKKHLNKLILGILFLLAVGAGIVGSVLNPNNTNQEQTADGIIDEIPKDYIIDKSTDILVNEDNYIHTDDTMVKGILSDIAYSKEDIRWFKVITEDKLEYKVEYKNMELISTQIVKTEGVDGYNQVHLYYRTGGDIDLKEGNEVKLYKTESGEFSFDERKHDKQPEDDFSGTITDFVFLPSDEQTGDIYISHIIAEDSDGNIAEVYLHNLESKDIKSDGDLRIYYIGKVNGSHIFDTEESDDFAITLQIEDKTYILQKGQEINLKNNKSKRYWEIKDPIDSKIYKAKVTGFEFGFTGESITSLDYININVDGKDITLTMLQTNAQYAIPYGDYKKVYKYEVHDKVLDDIEPMEEFLIELYYENDVMLEVSMGSEIWVYKNSGGFWTVDYTYEEEVVEEE